MNELVLSFGEKRDQRHAPEKSRGHEWRKDEDGHVDVFAYEVGFHNGPVCVKCGYYFCHHCQTQPTKDCKGE